MQPPIEALKGRSGDRLGRRWRRCLQDFFGYGEGGFDRVALTSSDKLTEQLLLEEVSQAISDALVDRKWSPLLRQRTKLRGSRRAKELL
jgi:hypothetical protein